MLVQAAPTASRDAPAEVTDRPSVGVLRRVPMFAQLDDAILSLGDQHLRPRLIHVMPAAQVRRERDDPPPLNSQVKRLAHNAAV